MKQGLSTILLLLIVTATLFTPSRYTAIIYPLIGIIITLMLRSIIATIFIFITNIIFFSSILEKSIFSINFNLANQILKTTPAIIIVLSESIIAIYLIILIILNIKRNSIKDSLLISIISITKYYKRLLLNNIKIIRNQLFYASIFMLELLISNNMPPYSIYFSIAVIPLYLLVAPIYDTLLLQLVSSITFVASLKYPPLLLLLYYVKNVETIGIAEELRKKNGTEIGWVIAALIELPLVRYRDKNIQIDHKYLYDWAPLPITVPYKINIDIQANPHIVISGASGSGKSYTAAKIATRVASETKSSIVIIDPHGEYKYLLGKRTVLDALSFSINPLDLQGKSPRQRAIEVATLISSLYKLGPLQQHVLEEAILLAYEAKGIVENDPATWRRAPPTLSDVAQVLRQIASRDKRAYIVAVYVESLISRAFSKTSIPISLFFNSKEPTIIDLSSIREKTWQQLYMNLLLEKLYIAIREKDLAKSIRTILVIDEAHLVASKHVKKNIVANMAAELRKYGLALILITQRLDDLDKSILANMGTKIALRQVEPRLAKYVAESIAISDNKEEINILTQTLGLLPKGYAVIRDYYVNKPLMLRIS